MSPEPPQAAAGPVDPAGADERARGSGAVEVKRIGIVVFDGVEELDAIGPWEVLAFWCRVFPGDGWDVLTLSPTGGAVRCAKGLVVQADHAFADCPPLQVLLYPGGGGAHESVGDPARLDWVRAQRTEVPLVTSVCTGALVLAAAGLLRDKPATTHFRFLDQLAALDPTIDVRPGARFVDAGDTVTAAGISAGIDMALHLVARLAGVDRAREVRRSIEYDPQPPV